VIVARSEIQLALYLATGRGQSEDEAVADVAARYCIPEEAVREVADELAEEVSL
jgi:hypothetical protein